MSLFRFWNRREEYIDEEGNKSEDEIDNNEKTVLTKESLTTTTRRRSKAAVSTEEISPESIYDFYADNLLPAIVASIPILLHRVKDDATLWTKVASTRLLHFLIPWSAEQNDAFFSEHPRTALEAIWNQSGWSSSSSAVGDDSAMMESMLTFFDANEDGTISGTELLPGVRNLLRNIRSMYPPPAQYDYRPPDNWLAFLSTAWPVMDWKVGVFLWRTCGGLLLVIIIATVVPGRLHGLSGRLLRWPILAITYFMIAVELAVYVIIRLTIKLAEAIFANPKHRALRRAMANAKNYDHWYQLASTLDASQGRDKWKQLVDDDTSYRYNWSFINELMVDMRKARKANDSLMALAVLQQCTRKNVGGVMSEDLFSYTNTGEPKHIVKLFLEEVETTLRWVTEQAKAIPMDPLHPSQPSDGHADDYASYHRKLQSKVHEERNKISRKLFAWATLNILAPESSKTMRRRDSAKSEKSLHDRSESADFAKTQLPPEHRDRVKTFLRRARAAYGRTALCLSGGAAMGNYHFGAVKALLEQDALPHIISGTSAGSVVGALLCTRTDEELHRDLDPHVLMPFLSCFSKSWPDRIRNVIKKGHLFDNDDWLALIRWFCGGDITFEEAYRKTGRVLCITLSATTKKAPPVLINYISAPNVVIASAVVASAAVPGFIAPALLQVKGSDGVVRTQEMNKDQLYWDGSIDQDIPTSGLAEMLNCQFFVASQCNPHIVPFFYNSKGDVGRPSRWSSGMRDDSWRGGFLLSALELYLKSDMRAKFRFLDDLEAVKGFAASLFSQQTYGGSTTIVPNAAFQDFFKLFSDPTISDMKRYFQGGSVAAFQHISMIKLHYHVANALEECLAELEETDGRGGLEEKPRRRRMLLQQKRSQRKLEEHGPEGGSSDDPNNNCVVGYSIDTDPATSNNNTTTTIGGVCMVDETCSNKSSDITVSCSGGDDEMEGGGFDGVDCSFSNRLVTTN